MPRTGETNTPARHRATPQKTMLQSMLQRILQLSKTGNTGMQHHRYRANNQDASPSRHKSRKLS